MHRLAHRLVAPEAENDRFESPPDTWAPGRFSRSSVAASIKATVVVVLLDTRGHGKDVRIKDDVFGPKADSSGQDVVGTLGDLDLALENCRPARPRRRP